jgi:hypothetical protein
MHKAIQGTALALAIGFGSIGGASAAMQTLEGAHTVFTFDDALLGQYGTPTVVGDTLAFWPTSFEADSTGSRLGMDLESALLGITVSAKAGYTLSGIDLTEGGSYLLFTNNRSQPASRDMRAQSFGQDRFHPIARFGRPGGWGDRANRAAADVSLAGKLTVRNFATFAAVSDSFTSTDPLKTTGTLTDWTATASASFAGWSTARLSLDNLLFAHAVPGRSLAFIDTDFIGASVLVSAVPEPETYAMFLAGLGLIGSLARRRRQG